MASRNDVTGDLIKSRKNSKEFEDNFDKIFRKNKDPLCDVCGRVLDPKKECAWTGCPLNWDEKRADIIGSNGNIGYEEDDING
jgi:hypothetical protein